MIIISENIPVIGASRSASTCTNNRSSPHTDEGGSTPGGRDDDVGIMGSGPTNDGIGASTDEDNGTRTSNDVAEEMREAPVRPGERDADAGGTTGGGATAVLRLIYGAVSQRAGLR